MDENKKENLENELEPEVSLNSVSASDETQATDTVAETTPEAESEKKENTYTEIDGVESEKELESFLNDVNDAPGDEVNDEEAVEKEITLAKYAADCENCATKVYFELEDLDEEGNLICPNCNESIEINQEALDYYLVDKSNDESEDEKGGSYIVDCGACEAVVHFSADDIDDDENIVCPQCGEKIHIETEVLDAYKEKDIQKHLKKKKVLKKVGFACLGVVLAIAIWCAILFFAGNKSVVKVDGTSVPMNVYKAVYYIENAANYTSSGFNIDEKPSKQTYENSEDYKTWDDFLKSQTVEALKLYYGIYNEGKKAGYEMTEKDEKSVTDAIKNVNTYAQQANQSFDDYMKSMYGLKISEEDFAAYLELTAYVRSYYKSVMLKDITKEQLEKIYKENPDNFEVVSFRYYYVQVNDTMTKEKALKTVEKIAKAKDEKQFHKLVVANVSKENAAMYKDADSTLVKDMAVANIQNRPVAELLNNPKAKKGETIFGLSDDEKFAEVAMLVEAKHKSNDLLQDAAINTVSAEKGQKFVDGISEKTEVKSGLGMILRNIMF